MVKQVKLIITLPSLNVQKICYRYTIIINYGYNEIRIEGLIVSELRNLYIQIINEIAVG